MDAGARCSEIIARSEKKAERSTSSSYPREDPIEPRRSPPGGNDPSPHGSFDVKRRAHLDAGSERIPMGRQYPGPGQIGFGEFFLDWFWAPFARMTMSVFLPTFRGAYCSEFYRIECPPVYRREGPQGAKDRNRNCLVIFGLPSPLQPFLELRS